MSSLANLSHYGVHVTRRLESILKTLQSASAKDPKLKFAWDVQLEDLDEIVNTLNCFFLCLDSESVKFDTDRRGFEPSDPEYIAIEEMLKRFAK